jgi:hypothetical protein
MVRSAMVGTATTLVMLAASFELRLFAFFEPQFVHNLSYYQRTSKTNLVKKSWINIILIIIIDKEVAFPVPGKFYSHYHYHIT